MARALYASLVASGLTLVGLLGFCTPSLAEPIGRQFIVDPTPQNSQRYPSVASLADGGWVAVWKSGKDWESDGDIYGQRFDAANRRVGEEFRVNTFRKGNQTAPAVAGLKKGGFVVAWASGLHGLPDGVFGQRYSAAGKPLGGEFRINTYRPDAQLGPSIAALRDGGFVVTWSSEGQDDGDRYGVFGQRFARNGEPVGDEFGVNTHTRNYQTSSSVDVLEDGRFIVVWASRRQAGVRGWGVYGQLYGPAGGPIGGEFPVDPDTGEGGPMPTVSALTGGGFVVGWTTELGDLFGRRFDGAAQPIGERFLVGNLRYFVAIASAGLVDGGFVLVWTASSAPGVYTVLGRRYAADGTSLGPSFPVNSRPPISPWDVSVTGLGDGGFVAAWSDDESIDEFDLDVLARRFTAD